MQCEHQICQQAAEDEQPASMPDYLQSHSWETDSQGHHKATSLAQEADLILHRLRFQWTEGHLQQDSWLTGVDSNMDNHPQVLSRYGCIPFVSL